MSTKRLSRTLLEAGTYHGSRKRIQKENTTNRHLERQRLHELTGSPDADLMEAPSPKPSRGAISRDDKLAPIIRFLNSAVGRNWDKVLSEIRQKFPINSLQGMHIWGHIENYIERGQNGPRPLARWARFYLDQQNRLQRTPKKPRKRWSVPDGADEAIDWLNGRRLVQQGAEWFWLDDLAGAAAFSSGTWRQGKKLTKAERADWDGFGPEAQNYIIKKWQ